nr:GPGG-motif small membrane protein [Frankia sp. Cppng1_Ct_nod]
MVVSGIFTIFRGSVLNSAPLIVAGLLIDPGGVSVFG